jgi:O-antigen/teichoic acid export membrane protein
MASQITLFPIAQVTQVVLRVLFPTLAQLQDNPDHFRRAYLKSTSVLAVLVFPAMLGLAAVAHDATLIVFGEQWLPMVHVVRCLAFVGLIHGLTAGLASALASMGRAKLLVFVELAGFVPYLAPFAIGASWGLDTVASIFVVIYFIFIEGMVAYCLPFVGLRSSTLHAALYRPALAATLMAAAVFAMQSVFAAEGVAPALSLTACITAGVVFYVVASWLINRIELLSIYQLVLGAMRHTTK